MRGLKRQFYNIQEILLFVLQSLLHCIKILILVLESLDYNQTFIHIFGCFFTNFISIAVILCLILFIVTYSNFYLFYLNVKFYLN